MLMAHAQRLHSFSKLASLVVSLSTPGWTPDFFPFFFDPVVGLIPRKHLKKENRHLVIEVS